jgi:dolichol kinase
MKLSEQIFVLTESSLYATVAFIVLVEEASSMLSNGISNTTDMRLNTNSLNYEMVRTTNVQLQNLSTVAILTASIMTILVMVARIRLYSKLHKKTQLNANDPSNSSDGGKQESTNSLCTDVSPPIDSIKDDIGLSFGSTLPPLVLHSICIRMRQASNGSSKSLQQIQDMGIMQLYTALLSCIGVSFAASCLILTIQQWRTISLKQRATATEPRSNIPENTKKKICMLTREHSDYIRILHTMLLLLPVLLSYTMYSILQDQDVDTSTLKMNDDKITIANNEMGEIYACLNVAWGRLLLHITIGFTIIESTLLFYYCYGRQRRNRAVQAPTSLSASSSMTTPPKLTPNSFQQVFSLGEWIVVSSFISILVTDYMFRYTYTSTTNPMANLDGYCSIKSFIPGDSLSSEMLVAQSGVLGCIFGLCIGTFINNWISNFHSSGNQTSLCNNLVTNCAIQFSATVCITVASLQTALVQFCMDTTDDSDGEWCVGSSASLPAPLPIRWLTWFLRQKEIIRMDSSSTLLSDSYSQLPRYSWLVYWGFILSIFGPMTFYLAQKLHNCDSEKRKKKLTVVSRKFFHFVAVALFTPVTAYAPKLMYLSYAIATALLMLVESLRVAIHTHSDDGNSNHPVQKQTTAIKQSRILGLNEFFETFYDEKDKRATEGSFVVTHVALIVGCATPLWLCGTRSDIPSFQGSSIIPFLGIVSVGVGDSAGAIIGSFFGKTQWPTSRRTVEGSFAMLVSMIACWLSFGWAFQFDEGNFNAESIYLDALSIYLPLTILEAVTLQIDNLCLPIMTFVLSQRHVIHM